MTRSKSKFLQALLLPTLFLVFTKTYSQEWKTEKRINILFGVAQPALAKGFNIEGNYIHNRFIFDYSHGLSLDFSGDYVPSYLRKQHIAIHEPYTTGFGVGYRIREWINIRIEPKWHKFEFYYDGEPQNDNTQITSYKTFSLGLGLYGAYRPFKRQHNFLKGFLIAPSIRFWPTVNSSLKDGKFTYLNKQTGSFEEIKRLQPGSGFTPLVVNVSLGYSFKLNNL